MRRFPPFFLMCALAIFCIAAMACSNRGSNNPLVAPAKSAVQGDEGTTPDLEPQSKEDGDDLEQQDEAGDDASDEESIALDTLPPAVRAALDKAFPAGELIEAETETEKGRRVFDVDLLAEGRKLEVKLDENGEILEVEQDDANGPQSEDADGVEHQD